MAAAFTHQAKQQCSLCAHPELSILKSRNSIIAHGSLLSEDNETVPYAGCVPWSTSRGHSSVWRPAGQCHESCVPRLRHHDTARCLFSAYWKTFLVFTCREQTLSYYVEVGIIISACLHSREGLAKHAQCRHSLHDLIPSLMMQEPSQPRG